MEKLAKFFSLLLHPLLMPFYGMIAIFTLSYLSIFPLKYKATVALTVLFFTYILPALSIFIMYKTKQISSISLNNQNERFYPYLICLISYLFCGLLLYKIQIPIWILFFIGGGLLSILINTLVNFKWKISAHMAGIGGLLGLIIALSQVQQIFPMWILISVILLAGILGTSRIYLGRHSLMQVTAGFINGFICIYGALMLSFSGIL